MLKQYHFERDLFVKTFEEVFNDIERKKLYDLILEGHETSEFKLWYYAETEECYILYKRTGTFINWYKLFSLGRTNTCNNKDFTAEDLKTFLTLLKEDLC